MIGHSYLEIDLESYNGNSIFKSFDFIETIYPKTKSLTSKLNFSFLLYSKSYLEFFGIKSFT